MADLVNVDRELEDLIDGFLQNRQKDLLVLKRLASDGSWDEIAKIGHRLKGTSGGYGFEHLSGLGKLLEDHGKLSQAEPVLRAITEMERHLGALKVNYVDA
jgi:HPt (histidine-containing phosphotransfer) domain-containing protein